MHDPSPDWHAGAASAAFAFYEPDTADGDERFASGHGWNEDAVTSLGVNARVGGKDVNVQTRSSDGLAPDRLLHRSMLHDLAFSAMLGDEGPLELPFTITVVGDDRTLDVDGSPVTFRGLRVDGHDRWSGLAHIGDVVVTVRTTATEGVSLRRCTDVASVKRWPSRPPE